MANGRVVRNLDEPASGNAVRLDNYVVSAKIFLSKILTEFAIFHELCNFSDRILATRKLPNLHMSLWIEITLNFLHVGCGGGPEVRLRCGLHPRPPDPALQLHAVLLCRQDQDR